MSTLVERLRESARHRHACQITAIPPLPLEQFTEWLAADRIVALEADNATLKADNTNLRAAALSNPRGDMTTLTTCRDCKFFEARPPMGLCHRYPPQVVGSFVGTPDPGNPTVVNGRIANDTFWPVVPPTAWCGEFRTNLLIPGNNN